VIAELRVPNANGQPLAYVYFEEEPGRRTAAKLLTRDAGDALRKVAAVSKTPPGDWSIRRLNGRWF
jgi:hypothetical protein